MTARRSLDTALAQLESADLVCLAQAQPELAYLFRHALIHDAAYGSLLRVDRRVIHRQVGETLARLYPERVDELAALLAWHFAEAGDDARAAGYWLQAGDRARQTGAYAEAAEAYQHAARLLRKLAQPEQAARALRAW